MPRKMPTEKDLERGGRLLEIRKKIWGSRDKFSASTGISAGTLEGWEKKGIDISTRCLSEIVKHGGDVEYILTGKKAAAREPSPAAGTLSKNQKQVVSRIQKLICILLEIQQVTMEDAAKADRCVSLLDKTQANLEGLRKVP